MPELATDQVEQTLLGHGAVRIAGSGHVAVIARLKPGHLLVTERGTQTRATRAAMIKEVEAEIAATNALVTVFIDVRASDRMDAGGREEWAAFGTRKKAHFKRVVVLVRSKLLEMAFSVMGMFVGGGMIQMVSSEDDLVAEIRRDVPNFKGLTSLASLGS
jgi:hypothetical protein